MKPYYEHAGITIYNGDCREVLPQLGPHDLILTDPNPQRGTSPSPRSQTSLSEAPRWQETDKYGLSPQESRRALEGAAYRKRIRGWITLFQKQGYNAKQYERDFTAAAAAAMLLAGEETPSRHRILRTAMERITAAAIINLPAPQETP